MRHLIVVALISLGLFSGNTYAECGKVKSNNHGICSHNNFDQVVAGTTLNLKWNLKSSNRDRVIVDITYSSTSNGLVTESVTLTEKTYWSKTPTSYDWVIPCEATGAITVKVTTYNRWYLGIGNVYTAMESYLLTLTVRTHYFADPANIIVCEPGTITLEQSKKYVGAVPVWYEGIGTSGPEIGRGYSIDVDLDQPDSYAFTVKFTDQNHSCSNAGNSIPAIQYVHVIETDMALFDEKYILDEDDGPNAGDCVDLNTFQVLDVTLIGEDIETALSNFVQDQYSPVSFVNLQANGSWGTDWNPTNYRYDGTTMKACSYDMFLALAYEWNFEKTTSVRYQSSIDENQYYLFSSDQHYRCDVTTKRVTVKRRVPGIIFPEDSLLDIHTGILAFDDSLSCDKGSIEAVERTSQTAIIGPSSFLGDASHYNIQWEPTPGLVDLTALNPSVDLTQVAFDEYDGNAHTFYATVNHLPSGIQFSYCHRLVKGSKVPVLREETDQPSQIKEEPIQFEVFPNPGNSLLTAQVPAGAERIRLLNLNGQVVLEQNTLNTSQVQLATDELSNGLYIVQLYMNDGRVLDQKWIKSE